MFTFQLHLCMYMFITAVLVHRATVIEQVCNIPAVNIYYFIYNIIILVILISMLKL